MCKKRGGHARIYSPKDIVKSFSLIGMVSGKRRIMVVALEPGEGKAKFYHEVCYCFTKMIVHFLNRKLRVLGNGRRVLIFSSI